MENEWRAVSQIQPSRAVPTSLERWILLFAAHRGRHRTTDMSWQLQLTSSTRSGGLRGAQRRSCAWDNVIRGFNGWIVRRGLPLRCEERLEIGDRWPLEWGGKGGGILCATRTTADGPFRLWCTHNRPFTASMGLQTSFASLERKFQLICYSLFSHYQSLQ